MNDLLHMCIYCLNSTGDCIAAEFPASAMLPGDLYLGMAHACSNSSLHDDFVFMIVFTLFHSPCHFAHCDSPFPHLLSSSFLPFVGSEQARQASLTHGAQQDTHAFRSCSPEPK